MDFSEGHVRSTTAVTDHATHSAQIDTVDGEAFIVGVVVDAAAAGVARGHGVVERVRHLFQPFSMNLAEAGFFRRADHLGLIKVGLCEMMRGGMMSMIPLFLPKHWDI